MVQFPKTDVRYWREKVERHGKVYSIQIYKDGERHRFSLETPNKVKASQRAHSIYLELLANGWASALERFGTTKHEGVRTRGKGKTVGSLIEAAREFSTARPDSFEAYEKAFRKIVSDVMKIDKMKKFDSRKGGSVFWRETVDKVPLTKITPAKVTAWKNQRLQAAGKDQTQKKRTTNTTNSLIRNAKALFGKKLLPFLPERVALPSPLPFDQVSLEKSPSVRYQSKIDASKIVALAQEELAGREESFEAFKAFVLALVCGLRRSEIDHLQWDAIEFEARVIRVEDTKYKQLKSEDSAGEVDLDEMTLSLFQEWRQDAPDEIFVLRSNYSTSLDRKSRSYRCDATFTQLCKWLRANGVDENKPIHTLRKEIGSLITEKEGIYAASKYLRHSDIRITASIYTDKKKRVVAGLLDGALVNS